MIKICLIVLITCVYTISKQWKHFKDARADWRYQKRWLQKHHALPPTGIAKDLFSEAFILGLLVAVALYCIYLILSQ